MLFCVVQTNHNQQKLTCQANSNHLHTFGGIFMTIGERVFFLLDKYGLQQKELADAINVSKATVNGWKIRKGSPSADLISPIAKFFHVSTDFLLTGEEAESKTLSLEDEEWLNIIHRIPEDRQSMCKDFLRTHMVIPEKYADKRQA